MGKNDKRPSGKDAGGKGGAKGSGKGEEKDTKTKGAQSINVRHILVSEPSLDSLAFG
jgi:hypothetical protein